MPPIRRYAGPLRPNERSASVPKNYYKLKKAKAKARKPAKNYNNQRPRNFQKKTTNMLQIKTLQPKEQLVSLQYKTTIKFSNMGYSLFQNKGATGTIIRVSLTNPTYGSQGSIVDVLDLGGNWVNPGFSRTNSAELNLTDKLNEFFDVYQKGIVVNSNSQIRIKSQPNQKELGQHYAMVDADGSLPGNTGAVLWQSNHPRYMEVNEATKDGDSYVWSVKQRQTGLLIDADESSTATYHELTNDIPGVKMRQLTAYKNGTSSKSVLNSARFTPRYYGMKDWRDNIDKVQFMPGVPGAPANINDLKKAFHYVGICNLQTPLETLKPQNVVAEVVVNFDCLFLNRKNDKAGGDAPVPQVPHLGDL